MEYLTGKALIRRRTGQPSVNIVSEDRTFRRQPDGSMLPINIELKAETENINNPTYEWFVVGVNESGGRKWVKIENSNSNTYNVSPPELNADGEEAWTKKTFKVTVSDISQAVIVSDTIIIEVEEPVEVGGVNLLTRDNWEQGALNKQAEIDSAYDELKTYSTKVLRVINLVSVGYNHVYSIGNTDYEYAYINFTGSRVYEGPAYYSEWKDKNSYVRRPSAGNNYVAVMLRKKNGGDITIDDFEKSRLKLENGTVATDWTPSPSDSWIKYDPATDTLYVEKSFYSMGGISALGLGESGSGGGGGVDMLDSWTNYTEAKANYYVPSSLLVSFRSNTIAQITGLQDALDTKQNTLIAGANITISDNTISASGGMSSVAWGDITDKPTTFEPSTHTHPTTDITDLGNIATINKNNSTANYLRGDGTWATPPNTNTTYSAGNGISLSSTTFSVAGGNGLVQETSGLALGKPSTITNSTTNSVGEDSHTHALTVTKADVGLGNVTNESKATMFANPTFTGTVKGVTKAHVGLGNVDDVKQATKSEFDSHTANSEIHIISSERTNWDDAFANIHTHGNKKVIDVLTQGHINVLNKLSLDAQGNVKVDATLWATGGISALGLGEGGGGSGGGVDMLDSWANYTEAKANYYVPSSLLVSFRDYTLDRLSSIEGGSASAITTTGTGNAITSVSKVENTLTFEKGNTFSLSTHTHKWAKITDKPETFAPSAHTHGNITNDGKIGTTKNLMIQTSTDGVLVAKSAGTTAQYLRGDGSWATPPNTNTTYSAMSVEEGEEGTATSLRTMRADYLKQIIQHYDTNSVTGIRAGASGTNANSSTSNPYIKVLDDSTYRSQIRLSGDGATSVSSDASGNITISSTNTVYTHPNYTAYASGLYKITTNTLGHVTGATAVVKSDITALGIPAQDTVYTHPNYTARASGLYKITVNTLGHISAATAVVKSDITALGIPAQDTVYTHPTKHPATIITQTASARFVTDTEKSTWNAKATPADITTAIDGIEIGGRNLAEDSKYGNIGNVANFEVENIDTIFGKATRFKRLSGSGNYQKVHRCTPVVGREVTISVKVKHLSGGAGFGIGWSAGNNIYHYLLNTSPYKDLGDGWKLYSQTREFNGSGTFSLNSINGELIVCDLKVEYGTKATDWTPAPEDTEREVLEAQGYMKARYIRDYVNGSSVDSYNYWVQIKALNKAGTNIAFKKTVTSNITTVNLARITNGDMDVANYARTSGGNQYVQIDLGQVYYDIDNIIVHHYWANGRTFYNTKTQISEDGTTWKTIFDSAVEGTYAETSGGKVHAHKGLDDKLNLTGGTLTGILTASAGVNTPKVDFGNGFTIEPSGTELVFKYNGVIKQRMLSNGTILATGGITALTTN